MLAPSALSPAATSGGIPARATVATGRPRSTGSPGRHDCRGAAASLHASMVSAVERLIGLVQASVPAGWLSAAVRQRLGCDARVTRFHAMFQRCSDESEQGCTNSSAPAGRGGHGHHVVVIGDDPPPSRIGMNDWSH